MRLSGRWACLAPCRCWIRVNIVVVHVRGAQAVWVCRCSVCRSAACWGLGFVLSRCSFVATSLRAACPAVPCGFSLYVCVCMVSFHCDVVGLHTAPCGWLLIHPCISTLDGCFDTQQCVVPFRRPSLTRTDCHSRRTVYVHAPAWTALSPSWTAILSRIRTRAPTLTQCVAECIPRTGVCL